MVHVHLDMYIYVQKLGLKGCSFVNFIHSLGKIFIIILPSIILAFVAFFQKASLRATVFERLTVGVLV